MAKKWRGDDISYLCSNYNQIPIGDLITYLGREENSIRLKAKELRLTETKPPAYTPEEDEIILKNYNKVPVSDLANELKRSVSSLRKRANLLFVQKKIRKVKTTFIIQDDIDLALPKAANYRKAIDQLKIDQSFSYDQKDRMIVNQIRMEFPYRIFKTVKVSENERRIWRIL